MSAVRTVGVLVGLVALGGLVTAAGRRFTDPLESVGSGLGDLDVPDEDGPLWVELPLEPVGGASPGA